MALLSCAACPFLNNVWHSFKPDIIKTSVEMSLLPKTSSSRVVESYGQSRQNEGRAMMDPEADLKFSAIGTCERNPVSVYNLQRPQQMLISSDFTLFEKRKSMGRTHERIIFPLASRISEKHHVSYITFTTNKSCFDFLRRSHSNASKSAT